MSTIYEQLDSNGFSRVPVAEIALGAGRRPLYDPNGGWNPPIGQGGKDNDLERRRSKRFTPPVDFGGVVLIGAAASPIRLFNVKTVTRSSDKNGKEKADFYASLT